MGWINERVNAGWDSEGMVPFYKEIKTQFKTVVDSYLKTQELIPKITALKKQRRTIENGPSSREEYLNKLKKDFSEYLEARDRYLQERLGENRNAQVNFFLERSLPKFSDRYPTCMTVFTWPEIEKAVRNLPEGTSIKDKEKKIAALDKEIKKLEDELKEASPPSRYRFSDGKAVEDKYERFVNHWFEKQSYYNGPVGPQGISLLDSDDDEKDAYKRLNIKAAINEARGNDVKRWY